MAMEVSNFDQLSDAHHLHSQIHIDRRIMHGETDLRCRYDMHAVLSAVRIRLSEKKHHLIY